MNKKKIIIAPVVIGLIFIGCIYYLNLKESEDRQIHAELESLKVEIDISNGDYDAASDKLIKLVHPSSELSSIEHSADVTSKEFWNDLVKQRSNNYRYNEYWSEQRAILLEEINESKNIDKLKSIITDEYQNNDNIKSLISKFKE